MGTSKNPIMVPKANLPYYFYKAAHQLYLWHIPFIPKIIKILIRFVFGAIICPETKIGKNVHFAYNALGIVIHPGCVIGDEVWISQQVTLGGREDGFPTIGDGVYIGSGAKILGNIRVGNCAKIGANAVVLIDVPDGATAVGVPAKIILAKT
jgi:serine O-acetyltransferase